VHKDVIPARADTFKFCSYACRGAWRKEHWTGENHPGWTGGERTKTCQKCGKEFAHERGSPYATFKKQKFCSKPCADVGGIRYFGSENANWNGGVGRPSRGSAQRTWAQRVISRDGAACRVCGVTGVELHAHHIKTYKNNPDKRWDLENGLTVCHRCHWDIHSKRRDNGVNSGEPVPDQKGSGGNPEPSFGRKPVEGVTTNGQAYRRWEGNCDWCGTFLSRRWSDAKDKAHHFCDKRCAGKYSACHRSYRRAKNLIPPVHGGNADTSALAAP
jgi:hypothetical protein